MVKLLVLADLHLDEITDKKLLRQLGQAICKVGRDADALIIAGDLTENALERWPGAIAWLGQHYPTSKTILLPGNHDYYGGNLNGLDDELEKLCAASGCIFAQCRSVVFGEVRVLLTTLWTDMLIYAAEDGSGVEDAMAAARAGMPDYRDRVICVSPERNFIEPSDTMALHHAQKRWLASELGKEWQGPTVIVTHHAPSAQAVIRMSPLSPCFASDLEDVMEAYKPHLWLFGHTHQDLRVLMSGGTHLENVSLGYECEVKGRSIEEMVRGRLYVVKDND